MRTRVQKKRLWYQSGFFVLFILAPIFDLFRYDLNQKHFYLLGQHWTLGLDLFQQGLMSPAEASVNLILRGFLPVLGGAALFIFIAWRWGRLYCGWMCPHYSVVELINNLMYRASGKPSLWENNPLPELQPDGTKVRPARIYWLFTFLAVALFSFVWAVSLLTYLLPPQQIYSNLLHGELTRNQFVFITAATLLLSIEFTFARHFFCRFGCAVGFFQSLAWMSNRRAMVINFDYQQAGLCKKCNNACDNGCPMRLKPRSIKRRMFTCTQCGECISACTQQQGGNPQQSLLLWVEGQQAEQQSQPPVGIPQKKKPL
ncbi:MAG: 4Fe-4S binding protein [Gammaproteobacteria bacterium]|nr:4Fe-4S binding protein [Gammaproteobacteria bacterium]